MTAFVTKSKQLSAIFLSLLFGALLLIKCVIFTFYLDSNTTGFPFAFWIPCNFRMLCTYFSFCCLITAFMFITKRKGWTIVFSLVLDMWLISNLIYYRSYGDLLNSWCVQNISNMQGFWGSVFSYLLWKDLLFPISSIIWIIILHFYYKKEKFSSSLSLFCCSLCCAVFCYVPSIYAFNKISQPIWPFNSYYHEVSMGRVWYASTFSPIAHFINENIILITHFYSDIATPTVIVEEVTPFLNLQNSHTKTDQNLLIILFESLETFCINTSVENQEITPYLNNLAKSEHAAFFSRVTPQVRQGMSSDAQFIINTGLLPVYDGAVSMRFLHNKFFTLSDAFQAKNTSLFVPNSPSSWNQAQMNQAFGYTHLYAQEVSDRILLKQVSDAIIQTETPFLFLTATLASHSPYISYADSASIKLQRELPIELNNYINSVHYTDACLGVFLNEILADSVLMNNTVIIITGDHTTFYKEKRDEYASALKDADVSRSIQEAFVPLIIYSPKNIQQNYISDKTVYQMDIYPTLLSLMGCSDYRWKGLGRNLLDCSEANTLSLKELSDLSDRIIRCDYFKALTDSIQE